MLKSSIKKQTIQSGMLRDPERGITPGRKDSTMHNNDITLRTSLRFLESDNQDILKQGGFGAILARAGVGKTAFLIQIAIDYLLRNRNILYISLNDPVEKVSLWYEEVYRNISKDWNKKQAQDQWDSLLPHRFIMTFKAEGFTIPILEERLKDLTEQGVFSPHILVIDGFPFDEPDEKNLSDLKNLVKQRSLNAWFTVRTHRHKEPGPDGMPVSLLTVKDLFDVIIQLQPIGSEIHVNTLKGAVQTEGGPELLLDPATLMVKNKP